MQGADMQRLWVAAPQPEQVPEAAKSFCKVTLQGVILQPISSECERKSR
jgi:hypothetical protein